MGDIAFKTVIVYFALLVMVRILGKREVGSLGAFDFLVALMLGEGIDEIIFGDVALVQGLTVIGIIAGLHYAMSWLGYKNKTIERLLSGSPTLLIENGRVIERALAAERLSRDELTSLLRQSEVEHVSDVKKAYLEPDGQVSVLKK